MKGFLQGKWLGHPLHPALVHIPSALLPAALVFDILSRSAGGNIFVQTSFYAILVGLVGALLAIPAGIADWSDIKREKPAWKIGLVHMILNLIAVLVWAINLGLRFESWRSASSVANAPFYLSILGTLILLVSGYLGGRMVYSYGISVARHSKGKWRRVARAGGANVPEK